jgi:hypothetical protein
MGNIMTKTTASKGAASKGERRSSARTKNTNPGQKMLNKINALQKGKDVVWSLPVVSKDGKVRPNKIIKANGKEYITSMKHNDRAHKVADA